MAVKSESEKKQFTVMLNIALYVEAEDEVSAIQQALTLPLSDAHRQNVQVVPGRQHF